jgi:hypothetical protein
MYIRHLRVSNHVGVTTIERLDQGHLYPLGERRDKYGRSANLKSYLDSLYAGYSEPLLGLRSVRHPVLYSTHIFPCLSFITVFLSLSLFILCES